MTTFDYIVAAITFASFLGLIFSKGSTKSDSKEVADSVDSNILTRNITVSFIINGHTNPIESIPAPVTNKTLRNWRTIPSKELVQEVVEWCMGNIILGKQRRVRPTIRINNSTKGSVLGEYFYQSKTIEIYYRKHKTIRELIETIIHEYVHHLQIRHYRDDMKYDAMDRKVGYYNNPYEVEARMISKKYREQCIRDIRIR